MSLKERFIESAVAIVLGLTILLTAIFTNAGAVIIVLGAILTAAGIGCLVWTIVDYKGAASKKAVSKRNSSTSTVEKKNTSDSKNVSNKVSNEASNKTSVEVANKPVNKAPAKKATASTKPRAKSTTAKAAPAAKVAPAVEDSAK